MNDTMYGMVWWCGRQTENVVVLFVGLFEFAPTSHHSQPDPTKTAFLIAPPYSMISLTRTLRTGVGNSNTRTLIYIINLHDITFVLLTTCFGPSYAVFLHTLPFRKKKDVLKVTNYYYLKTSRNELQTSNYLYT